MWQKFYIQRQKYSSFSNRRIHKQLIPPWKTWKIVYITGNGDISILSLVWIKQFWLRMEGGQVQKSCDSNTLRSAPNLSRQGVCNRSSPPLRMHQPLICKTWQIRKELRFLGLVLAQNTTIVFLLAFVFPIERENLRTFIKRRNQVFRRCLFFVAS